MKAEDIHNVQFGRSILIGSKQYPGWNRNKDGKAIKLTVDNEAKAFKFKSITTPNVETVVLWQNCYYYIAATEGNEVTTNDKRAVSRSSSKETTSASAI